MGMEYLVLQKILFSNFFGGFIQFYNQEEIIWLEQINVRKIILVFNEKKIIMRVILYLSFFFGGINLSQFIFFIMEFGFLNRF